MLKNKRHQLILTTLLKQGSILVTDIADMLQV